MCRLDDGRDLHADLHWIGVDQTDDPTGYRWLPDPLRWRTWRAGETLPPTPAGFWAVSVDIPEGAVGQGIWIDDQRVDVRWLPDPALTMIGETPMDWRPPVSPVVLRSPTLGRIVDPVRRSPITRWRYRLLLDGLRPDPLGQARTFDSNAPMTFDDPILEALASHTEDLWRAAIARVRQDDPDLATRFEQRLVDIADFGDGVFAPVWPTDQLTLDTLRDAIVSRRTTRDSRRRTVQQWLDEQPAAVAWVIDDAGHVDPLTGHALASIGVVNLGAAAMLAGATDPNELTRRDAVLIPAGAAETITVPVAPDDERLTSRVELEMGDWVAARPILAAPLDASPPGLDIGPLMADWTMTGWFVGVAAPGVRADGRSAAGLRLHQVDDAWKLYIECRKPLDERYAEPRAGADWVRIWFGPFGAPVAVYRIWRDGRAVNELTGDSLSAEVLIEHDRWVAHVDVDPALTEGGLVRMAVERIDARGRRFAWPEPMLPWQIEPGRAAVDVTSWD